MIQELGKNSPHLATDKTGLVSRGAAIVLVLIAHGIAMGGLSLPAMAQERRGESLAIELTPELLDKYVAMQRISGKQIKATKTPATDEKNIRQYLGWCRDAGFADPFECGRTIGVVGVLMTGYSRKNRRHDDPRLRWHHMIKRTKRDPDLSRAQKRQRLAEYKRNMQQLNKLFGPEKVPAQQLRLMDLYRPLILDAMRR